MLYKSGLAAKALASAIVLAAVTPSKADIIYTVGLLVGTGSVNGYITTDGTIGFFDPDFAHGGIGCAGLFTCTHITNYSLTLNDGLNTVTLTNAGVFTEVNTGLLHSAVSAT